MGRSSHHPRTGALLLDQHLQTSSPGKKIKLRVGTHGEDRPHVELPQYFPGQDLVTIEALGFAYRETTAFWPGDST
jgi:hypothetical protein